MLTEIYISALLAAYVALQSVRFVDFLNTAANMLVSVIQKYIDVQWLTVPV